MGSDIGTGESATKIACKAAGEDYDTLGASSNDPDKQKLGKLTLQGQEQYLAALHFLGLNRTTYGEM